MSFGRVIERRSNPMINCRCRDEILDREGFEPPLAFAKVVFKTTAFNHSAICPRMEGILYRLFLCLKSKKLAQQQFRKLKFSEVPIPRGMD